MNISYTWLSEYISLPTTPERTAEFLTGTGLEVSGIARFEQIPGGLKGLVIGEVVTCDKHPNADRLKVTTVSVGEAELVPIVCGAPNVAAGQKVVVALPGTTLHPIEGEPFKIKKGKIRGEVSQGMICAEDEIGLGTDHDGILVLNSDAPVGGSVADYLGVAGEEVIEIDLTPNRADAASHFGTARDLYALSAVYDELASVQLTKPSVDDFQVSRTDRALSVRVENTEACLRYCGVTISGLKISESPEWLQNRLRSIGLAPINNVVDVTNFVLHELGQPLHAFDADKIQGREVIVRTLPDQTPFTTLDGTERKLSEQDLMICDSEGGMCIAGVFGGINSGVTDTTTEIFLESAYFDPVWVRKTAKRHALNTDASFRFERGVDPNNTVYALKRAALLIQEVAGGEISSEIIDLYPDPIPNFEVEIRLQRLDDLANVSLDQDLVAGILKRLEIDIVERGADTWKLSVPPFKVDVTREADVFEEILRIYGYDRIPVPDKMSMALPSGLGSAAFIPVERASNFLVGNGFLEGMSNSQTRAAYYEQYDFVDRALAIEMINPLSSELNVMRQTFVFQALEAVAYNQNRQESDIRLFEFGRVYQQREGKLAERQLLGLTVTGKLHPESWKVPNQQVDFFYMKGVVLALMNHMGVPSSRLVEQEFNQAPYGYGMQLLSRKKEVLATFGSIDSGLLQDFDVRQEVFVAEIDWQAVLDWASLSEVTHEHAPKYPKVRRDLALLLDESVRFVDIQAIARATEKKLLQRVALFDVYEGKNLDPGKKSYAVSFEFRDPNQTLKDEQVDRIMQKLLAQFEKQVGAQLR